MIKYNLEIRHGKRLIITNNNPEQFITINGFGVIFKQNKVLVEHNHCDTSTMDLIT